MNIFEKIIDPDNIDTAYFDVVLKMEETGKTHRYSGFDAKVLGSYDFFSENLMNEIHSELKTIKKIAPALEVEIPKRTKLGKRKVYLHTIKERIKSQAVYRIVEPIFDIHFSKYLFSYRSSHPHYKAIRTVVRRYHKKYDEYVLIGDISSYSDIINPDVLKKQIQSLGFDSQTEDLLFSYVDVEYISEGVKKSSQQGIITGLPVTVLFNNLYLDSMDKKIGKIADVYRRVGDDFIVFGTYEKLNEIKKQMVDILLELKIPIDSQKITIQKKSEPFNFLGYLFDNGIISILPFSVLQIQKKIRSRLRYNKKTSLRNKKHKLRKILFTEDSLRYYFIQVIRQYNHVNNIGQIQFLSDYFLKRLVIYFLGSYTSRNHRKLNEIISDIKIPSLIKYHTAFHTGVYTGRNLKNFK